MTQKHITVSGQEIAYPDPSPDVAAFLDRARLAAADPLVSTDDLIGLLYGADNPILVHGMFEGRGAVTREVIDNPVYSVLLDLIDLKRVQRGELDVEKAHARYSVTVPEAAEQLGVTESAIRQAIKASRLSAVKKGGTWFIAPESLDSFQVIRKGPKPRPAPPEMEPVMFRIGSTEGWSAQLASDGESVITGKEAGLRVGEVRGSTRFGIRVVGNTHGEKRATVTLFEIDPSADVEAWEVGPFRAEGRFRIAAQFNHPREAVAAWKAYKAALPTR